MLADDHPVVRDGLKALLGSIPYVESAHPSPLSASRGFFGSRPFSRVNALLAEQGGTPVDWTALDAHESSEPSVPEV